MRLIVLGVNSPFPRDGRATLGYVLEANGLFLLIESGFGIHRRLREEALLDKLHGVYLSHLHSDHSADLPAVILGATMGSGREEKLPVYLPPGEADRLRQWLTACGFTFVLDHAVLHELEHGNPLDLRGLRLTTAPAAHSLPGCIAAFEAGGKKAVYTGDTGDCAELRLAIRGADLLLSEVCNLPPDQAAAKGHLTAEALGTMAREAGVGELLLTHFMPGSDPDALAEATAAAFGRRPPIAREGLRLEV